MPNWTRNVITTGDPSVITGCLDEDKNFDFNKLIPMPESLNVESGSRTDQAIAYYITERFTIPVWQTNLSQLISNPFNPNWAQEVVERVQEGMLAGHIKDLDRLYELGKQYIFNMENYGYYTWYEWSNANWGTKWNACDTCLTDQNTVSFDTAWSAPEPIFECLCASNPNVEIKFHCEYEEGFVAEYENRNGKLIATNQYELYDYDDDDADDWDEDDDCED